MMSPVETLITEHLDLWTTTVKRKSSAGRGGGKKTELYGIKKLRELILELAVRGLLVPQDAGDEPAGVLLERIAAEKAELVKDGVIKKLKVLPSISENEKLFPLQNGWKWCRWNDFTEWMTYGFTKPMPHVETGPLILTAKNVQYGYIDISTADHTSEEAFQELSDKDRPLHGDILITKDGSIGRAAIFNLKKPACINQSVAVLWMRACPFNREFLLNVIHSPYKQELIWNAAAGAAIKHISITKFVKFQIAIPPLEEQHRIVTKVNELMTLCDQLEQKTEANISAHQTLVETLLSAITSTNSANAKWCTVESR